MQSERFYERLFDLVSGRLSSEQMTHLETWYDYCQQTGIEPLDGRPDLVVGCSPDKDFVLSIWAYLGFVWDEGICCEPAIRQRTFALLMRGLYGENSGDDFDDLPDYDLNLPIVVSMTPSKPGSAFADEIFTYPETDSLPRITPLIISPSDGISLTWEQEKLTYPGRAEDLDSFFQQMPSVFRENGHQYAFACEAANLAIDFVWWACERPIDPISMSPGAISIFLQGRDIEWNRGRARMKFALKFLLAHLPTPSNFAHWLTDFDKFCPNDDPRKAQQTARKKSEQELRNAAIISLRDLLSTRSLASLTRGEISGDLITPELAQYLESVPGDPDDNLFGVSRSMIVGILNKE